MIARPPAIPASLAALVTVLGLGLLYWSLTGLGLLKSTTPNVVSTSVAGATPTRSGSIA